ncbi:MAG: polysaccharide deacetylase [Cyanobium sp. CACIAM 14]|nr:MAG: polysaccharide deacetylase [Cyanobium sp. CACIAM 14]
MFLRGLFWRGVLRRWWVCVLAALALFSALALPLAKAASQPVGRDPAHELVVLAYHEIAEPPQALMADYATPPATFEAQMGWLVSHGYHFVSVDQVLAARRGGPRLPEHPVLLSFDDGYRSVYTAAFPVLRRYRAPAVVAVVGRWLEPESGRVRFGDEEIARDRLLSWQELRTLQASGLVEVASHSYDLHHGVNGNPQLNSMPAASTRLYTPGQGYESEGAYRERLRADLKANADLLQRRLGHRPRVMVWPYGRYNATASAVAASLGMPVGLSLDDGANTADVPLSGLRRVLMTGEQASAAGLERELRVRAGNLGDTSRAAKVMHVDLDNIDDPDAAQVERNLQLLLERIRAMGVNTVYLQAYADPDGNGAADALYFPNRHLPVKRDLFSHVAWEIRTRTPVRRLYAWMPVLAFQLPAGTPGADQTVVTQPSRSGHLTMGYPRLSPFAPKAMATVREIYADLARSATFDGLLFHDDVTLSDYEDASSPALRQYRAWGLPTDLAAIRADDGLLGRWTNLKTAALERLTLDLASLVRADQPQLRTARNLYAQVVLNPHAEAWYAQSLEDAIRDYDFTAVMAMPFMERAGDPEGFLTELVARVKEQPHGLERVLFEIQSTDWHTRRDLPSDEMAGELRLLYGLGVRHTGYYPDNLHRGTPDPDVLRPVFQARSSAPGTT